MSSTTIRSAGTVSKALTVLMNLSSNAARLSSDAKTTAISSSNTTLMEALDATGPMSTSSSSTTGISGGHSSDCAASAQMALYRILASLWPWQPSRLNSSPSLSISDSVQLSSRNLYTNAVEFVQHALNDPVLLNSPNRSSAYAKLCACDACSVTAMQVSIAFEFNATK